MAVVSMKSSDYLFICAANNSQIIWFSIKAQEICFHYWLCFALDMHRIYNGEGTVKCWHLTVKFPPGRSHTNASLHGNSVSNPDGRMLYDFCFLKQMSNKSPFPGV